MPCPSAVNIGEMAATPLFVTLANALGMVDTALTQMQQTSDATVNCTALRGTLEALRPMLSDATRQALPAFNSPVASAPLAVGASTPAPLAVITPAVTPVTVSPRSPATDTNGGGAAAVASGPVEAEAAEMQQPHGVKRGRVPVTGHAVVPTGGERAPETGHSLHLPSLGAVSHLLSRDVKKELLVEMCEADAHMKFRIKRQQPTSKVIVVWFSFTSGGSSGRRTTLKVWLSQHMQHDDHTLHVEFKSPDVARHEAFRAAFLTRAVALVREVRPEDINKESLRGLYDAARVAANEE